MFGPLRGHHGDDPHRGRIAGQEQMGQDRQHQAFPQGPILAPSRPDQHDQGDGEGGQAKPEQPHHQLRAGQPTPQAAWVDGGHGLFLHGEETHRDSEFADARLLARIQDGGDLLELALGVAADQDPQVLRLAAGGGQPGGQFVQRDRFAVERDRAVAIDVDRFSLRPRRPAPPRLTTVGTCRAICRSSSANRVPSMKKMINRNMTSSMAVKFSVGVFVGVGFQGHGGYPSLEAGRGVRAASAGARTGGELVVPAIPRRKSY